MSTDRIEDQQYQLYHIGNIEGTGKISTLLVIQIPILYGTCHIRYLKI